MNIDRIRTYAAMRSRLTSLDDAAIRDLIKHVPAGRPGWGSTGIVRVNRRRVFVKRIPMTERECAEPLSTRNFDRVPAFYSYGIGSMGTNVWREVVAGTKATNWVLAGDCEGFPMMFHHRVLKRKGRRRALSSKWLDGYTRYWGGSKRIRNRVVERTSGPAELVVFMEYFPSVWAEDCRRDLSRVARGVEEITKIVEFLRGNGMIHFDAHPHNVLTDARGYYLADFGLAMDRDFNLDEAERKFLHRHTHYDRASVPARAAGFLTERFRTSSEKRRASVLARLRTDEPESNLALQKHLVERLDVVAEPLQLPDAYCRFLIRYREVINLVNAFDRSLIQSRTKRVNFPNRRAGTLWARTQAKR